MPYMAPQQQQTMRAMGVVLVPLSALATIFLPAGLQLFFLVSGGLQYLQAKIFYYGPTRRWLGLGEMQLGGAPEASRQASYEAPRIIDTTATDVTKTDSGVMGSFKDSFSAAREKVRDYQQNQERKMSGQKKADYTEKARLEEQARALERAEKRRAMRMRKQQQ